MKLALQNRQDDPRTADILAAAFCGRLDGASCGYRGCERFIDMKNILGFDSGKLPKFQLITGGDLTTILKHYENTFYIIFNSRILKYISAGSVGTAGSAGSAGSAGGSGWDLQ